MLDPPPIHGYAWETVHSSTPHPAKQTMSCPVGFVEELKQAHAVEKVQQSGLCFPPHPTMFGNEYTLTCSPLPLFGRRWPNKCVISIPQDVSEIINSAEKKIFEGLGIQVCPPAVLFTPFPSRKHLPFHLKLPVWLLSCSSALPLFSMVACSRG